MLFIVKLLKDFSITSGHLYDLNLKNVYTFVQIKVPLIPKCK